MRQRAGAWLILAFILGGCRAGGGAPHQPSPWEPPAVDEVVAVQWEPVPIAEQMKGQPGIVQMAVSEEGFDPPLLKVAAGEKVRIHLRNIGSRDHNLVVPRYGVVAGSIAPGGENYIEFTAGETGRWPFFSDAPGWEEPGLGGTLVVE